MLIEMHIYDVFKRVADLCFTVPFAVLGQAKYQYRPLRASVDGRTDRRMDGWYQTGLTNPNRQTNKRTLPNVLLFSISPASQLIIENYAHTKIREGL